MDAELLFDQPGHELSRKGCQNLLGILSWYGITYGHRTVRLTQLGADWLAQHPQLTCHLGALA